MLNFDVIQKTINYQFDNEDLLQQAFIRRSYSIEHGGQNNEVLEFIGDKALDLAVIRIMMERFGEITEDKDFCELKLHNPAYFKTKLEEGQFTDIKKDLVQKKALAKAMEKLGFESQLLMGKGDILNHVNEQDSVKEDLFEAIIGAVTIDCMWDMDIITDVVETMIDFDAYFEKDEDKDYVSLIQHFMQTDNGHLPKYDYFDTDEWTGCTLEIDAIGVFNGYGSNKAKARKDAAIDAYFYLKEHGYIPNEIEETIGHPEKEKALNQLNTLIQKELIAEPECRITKEYDDDGNTIWYCVYILGPIATCEYSGKKNEAKRGAAYKLISELYKG